MAFDIPNFAEAAHPFQAAPDSTDFEIVTVGSAGTGVVSGTAVTAQGAPDMTVAVAAGVIAVSGTRVAVVAVPVLAITAADATNPRIDLVLVSALGVVSVLAGVAAAVPLMQPLPASTVCLAAVYVSALAASIVAGDIIDKRVIVRLAPTACYVTAMAVAL